MLQISRRKRATPPTRRTLPFVLQLLLIRLVCGFYNSDSRAVTAACFQTSTTTGRISPTTTTTSRRRRRIPTEVLLYYHRTTEAIQRHSTLLKQYRNGINQDDNDKNDDNDDSSSAVLASTLSTRFMSPRDKLFCKIYCGAGLFSMLAWSAVVIIVVMMPTTATYQQSSATLLRVRLLLLPLAQALAFPLPITHAAFTAAKGESATALRLYFGTAVTFLSLLAMCTTTAVCSSSSSLPSACNIFTNLNNGNMAMVVVAGWSFAIMMFAMTSLLSGIAWIVSDGPATLTTYLKMIVGGSWKALFLLLPRSRLALFYFAMTTVFLSLAVVAFTVPPPPPLFLLVVRSPLIMRGYGAFLFLASMMAYSLKDAADEESLDSSEHVKLRRGLGLGSVLQVIVSFLWWCLFATNN